MEHDAHNLAKTYDILLKWKVFESLQSGFVIFGKKMFFVLDVAYGDPIFAKFVSKNGNFWGF